MEDIPGIVVRRTHREWARLVRKWQRSGKTARAFGDERGVNANTLTWWKWQLGRSSGGDRDKPPVPRLVPVEVVEAHDDDARVEVTGAGWELTNAAGVRLTVRGPLTGADLAAVLAAVTSKEGRR